MTISARQLLDGVLDPGSFQSWDRPPPVVATSAEYDAELRAARARSGADESVLTGEGRLRGRRVVVIACEFGFLAGSIGVAAAERIVAAVERATELGLPLLASPASGGTRMQEGTVAFVQMVKVAGAVAAHRSAGHPYLVYLRNPTMGGVFASWGSLGHMTFAEPGALIGFLGPRVYQALYGHSFPDGVQTAENLYRRGVIDGVVPLPVFRRIVHRVLNVVKGPERQAFPPDRAAALPNAAAPSSSPAVVEPRAAAPAVIEPSAATSPSSPAVAVPTSGGTDHPESPAAQRNSADSTWRSVLASRRPGRPGIRALLRRATDRVPLSGTGQGESDRTVVHALARLRGQPCVIFGHDRAGQTGENTMGPAALREARRSMHLAAELGLPLVLIIDTAGAALSREAEERGLAPEIARCLADLVMLDTPTISVLLGQGSGGGALALLPADRVLAAANGWLAPLPPEGASAIVHRDTAHAPELAAAQRISAPDLLADGIVDRIVPENPDAADEPLDFAHRMTTAIAAELATLRTTPVPRLRALRQARYRRLPN
ncbi:acetyl-CoA carboxyl transferase [Nocardia sp. CDC159]|uniref:Acetyl-coenzyme A carboxylase carboxyl transferase subunits beta/alpha n=1 Tax=Nocardia pulmonis TaxID=2951408 RepID=A0A9X2E3N7_9NOCA|nr:MULTISPECIES: carboxyl transferase domain-containing protein [Nocardia]MCM6773061.1 acetyl-CoA carboxyl transferase [Nocardia pulmonis]MCM6785636.1 acetyl-CoA carboxyl transferase [Nocardia sp. CDC159]